MAPQLFGAVLVGLVAAKVTSGWSLPFLRCSFKELTGLPCAFCGGTRAFRALAGFHLREALWWNPLTTIGAVGIVFWFVAWALLPNESLERLQRACKRLPVWPIAIMLVALNWIFVIRFLPR